MFRTIKLNGISEGSHLLDESENLLVIRLNVGLNVYKVLSEIPKALPFLNKVSLFESFPESNVFVLSIKKDKNEPTLKETFKSIVKESQHSDIKYIGSVLKYKDSGVYQLYTGNLFLKFNNTINELDAYSFFETYDLKLKLKLGFAVNSFFLEAPTSLGRDIFEFALLLEKNPIVEICYPELVTKRIGNQRFLQNNSNSNYPLNTAWTHELVNLKHVWKHTKGKGASICFIDDGIDFSHPAFLPNSRITACKDMMDKSGKRKPQHLFNEGHGTACASIACSADPRAIGIAPEASLMVVRTMGLGSVLEAEAIYWATQQGADIISCSWGPPDGNFRTLKKNHSKYPIPDHTDIALRYAAREGRNGKGCLVFFAAGNGDELISNDGYASHPDVLAIGAVNKSLQKTVYSDYGYPLFCCFPSGDFSKVAPDKWEQNSGIAAADAMGEFGLVPGDFNPMFTGSSASCPAVAGIAALLISLEPNVSKDEATQIIRDSCTPLGTSTERDSNGYHQQFGYGLPNLETMIHTLQNNQHINLKKNKMENSTLKTKQQLLALHIGINVVDNKYYHGLIPELKGCVNDKQNLENWSKSKGFLTVGLTNESATKENIIKEILNLAQVTHAEDWVLVTYAGHGAPIKDENADEHDGFDESWVTYNGFLIDDEINAALKQFKTGVNVIFLSDSCHSGTVARSLNVMNEPLNGDVLMRYIPLHIVNQVLSLNQTFAGELKGRALGKRMLIEDEQVMSNLLSFAACQDDEFAQELNGKGLFTTAFLDCMKKAESIKNYNHLYVMVREALPRNQNPKLFFYGPKVIDFPNHPLFENISMHNASHQEKNTVQSNPSKPSKPISPNKNGRLVINTSEQEIIINKGSNRTLSEEILPVIEGSIDAKSFEGRTLWDKAYDCFLKSEGKVSWVEPDIASDVNGDPTLKESASRNSDGDTFNWLHTYPPQKEDEAKVPFDWHLDNEHSQLKAAREEVFPEIVAGVEPNPNKKLVKIAHIDTGYLRNHPVLPKKHKGERSILIGGNDNNDGAIDYNKPMSLAEQQGHGNATLAILAGRKISSKSGDTPYNDYFGGNPFAEVISIKISETVVLLSGKNFAQAIDYAITENVDIITMSMAGWCTKTMADAVNRAYEAGVIICCATGNNWVNGIKKLIPKTVLYPARFERTIGVAGATYNHKPYVFDLHNPKTRAEGGLYMQMSYGPESAMGSIIAGYSPNIIWFGHEPDAEKDPLYVKNGGGTSSATPQVAAAASLYLQKYREEIEIIAGNEKWKKVEIVKEALFRTAYKEPMYASYLGNGIVKAANALKLHPSKIDNIKEAPKAQSEGSFFKKLFKLFSRNLLANESNETLKEMLGNELIQLMHKEEALYPLLELNFSSPNFDFNVEQKTLLLETLERSSLASDFLKKSILTDRNINNYTIKRNHLSPNDSIHNIELDLNGIQLLINSKGVDYEVGNVECDELSNQKNNFRTDTIEITLSEESNRSANSYLQVQNNLEEEGREGIVLVLKEINGEWIADWKFPEETSNGQTANRAINNNFNANGNAIDLLEVKAENRGIASLAGKIILKVFSWIKPKAKNKEKSNWENFLSNSVDYKYECYAIDLLENEVSSDKWIKISDNLNQPIWNYIIEEKKPLLMLFPGLFREVQTNFTDMLNNSEFKELVNKKYGRYAIGFNVPDVIDGISLNAQKIDKLIPTGIANKPCSVIARSRGGLVARYLFEKTWQHNNPSKRKFELEKLVFIATPNMGTPIANNELWKNLATNLVNLTGKAFSLGNPMFKGFEILLGAIVNKVTDLPGIDNLEENSELITLLNSGLEKKENYYAVAADFEFKPAILNALEEWMLDKKVFSRRPNDGVVPVQSVTFAHGNGNDVLRFENIKYVGNSQGVNHLNILNKKNSEILTWIASVIK